MLIVPPGVDVNPDDFSFSIPVDWDKNEAWKYRNDIQDIEEHNVGIQLSKSQLVQNVSGAPTGRVAPRPLCHCGLQGPARASRSLMHACSQTCTSAFPC